MMRTRKCHECDWRKWPLIRWKEQDVPWYHSHIWNSTCNSKARPWVCSCCGLVVLFKHYIYPEVYVWHWQIYIWTCLVQIKEHSSRPILWCIPAESHYANDSGLPQIQAKMNYNSTRWGDSVEQLIEQQPGPSFCAIDRYINAKGSVGTLKCLF